jgi:hypothetical protein
MGQLLIVQGPAGSSRPNGLFQAGIRCFQELSGLAPSSQCRFGSTAVASFPKRFGAPAGMLQTPGGNGWICGAGTCFYRGKSGAEALAGLRGESLTPDSQERDLSAIDGLFAIAFGDCAGEEAGLITDRLGSLHIYLTTVDTCLVVSTSSLVLAALAQPEWDPDGCREFLSVGTIYEKRTLFRGIEKLPPATVFRFRNGRLHAQSKYWNLGSVMYDAAPERGDVPRLAEALEEVIVDIDRNFARPVMDLTGGFDSRAILGAMLRAGRRFDTVVNGVEDLPDVVVSKRIAGEFGLRHRHQTSLLDTPQRIWDAAKDALAFTDGEYDVLLYNRVLDVHSRLAGDFDLSLNGSNGEIAKGYWWELLFPFIGWKGHFDDRRVAAARFAFEGEPPGLLAHRYDEDLPAHFTGIVRRANQGLERHPNTARLDNLYLTLRMQRWQGRIASATNRVWHCTSPFMWRRPMEAALSAPPRMRVRHRMTRRLIEYLDPKLAAIPLTQGYPALPLRPGTVHLFRPLAGEMWSAVAKRLRRFQPGRPRPLPPANPVRGLWSLEEVRETLDPKTMTSAALYHPERLADLLRQSQDERFGASLRFSRIVTLELLARRIRSAR